MTWMAAGAVRAPAERRSRSGGRGGSEVDVERTTATAAPRRSIGHGAGHGRAGHVAFARRDAGRRRGRRRVGLTRVVWIGTAQDVGRAINPQGVEGQIEGTAQGLGLALMEEIQTRDGLITTRASPTT